MNRPAYGYLSLSSGDAPEAETRLRHCLAEAATLEGLALQSVFVDKRDTQPYGFSALRALIRRTGVCLVVLPDLTHVEHIATVNGLTQAGLGRFLGAAVLVANVGPTPSGLG